MLLRGAKNSEFCKNSEFSGRKARHPSQPFGDLSETLSDLAQPSSDLAETLSDLSQPSGDLSETLGDLSQPSGDLAETIRRHFQHFAQKASCAPLLQRKLICRYWRDTTYNYAEALNGNWALGTEKFDVLRRMKMSDLKTCFVIAPIGEPDSEIRKRSNQILEYVIKPAANECGYEPLRADQISEPGIITSQVIQHIIDDPLVIADLTGRNPNVFYELAIRHAIRKPLIQMIANDEQLPFDVAGTRIIKVDYRDLDSVDEAKAEIIKQITAVMKDPSKVDSPISMSLNLQNLKQSEFPEQRSLADIIEAISEVNLGIKNIQNAMKPEPTLVNKARLIYIDTFMTIIRDKAEFLCSRVDGFSQWVISPDLDDEEKSNRRRELDLFTKQLLKIGDMAVKLQNSLKS
ncbi:MAG: hypothetical protein WA821_20860 [Anaerolineales bacterium]